MYKYSGSVAVATERSWDHSISQIKYNSCKRVSSYLEFCMKTESSYSTVFSADEDPPKIAVCFWIPHFKDVSKLEKTYKGAT